MTVKELIDHLYKCSPDLKVEINCDEVAYIIEHKDIITPENSYVEIT